MVKRHLEQVSPNPAEFDQMSFKEIGAVINSSEGAARVNYHYGTGRLREWLDETDER